MRKITTLSLLFIFLINGAGFFRAYQSISRKSRRRDKNIQSNPGNILQIAVSNGLPSLKDKGFRKVEKGEYVYQGHRYDVIMRVKKAGKTFISLTHDSLEDKLLSFLHSFFQPRSASEQNQASSTLKYGILKHFILADELKHSPKRDECDRLTQERTKAPSSPFQETLVPPPKQR